MDTFNIPIVYTTNKIKSLGNKHLKSISNIYTINTRNYDQTDTHYKLKS